MSINTLLDHPQYSAIEKFANSRSFEKKDYVEEHKIYRSYQTTKRIYVKTTYRNWDMYYLYSDNSFERYRVYSGLFVPVYNPNDLEFKVRRADVFDKLSRSIKKEYIKISDSEINKNFLIESKDKSFLDKIFSIRVLKDFLLNNKQFFFEMQNHSSFFNKAKADNLSFLGIFIINDWLVDEKILDQLLFVMQELLDGMQSSNIISDKHLRNQLNTNFA